MARVAGEIERRLSAALAPDRLEVIDESHRHRGHSGARPEGESHFRVLVVAQAFAGRSRIERQRMVHAALGELLQTDIHALAITAQAPGEGGRSG
ncbi:MAG: BolA family protein [Geminicoccaceae bacterium]|nr:BolA family protein [Geminicoccaceae bacterium]